MVVVSDVVAAVMEGSSVAVFSGTFYSLLVG